MCVSIVVLVISVVGPLKKLFAIFTSFGGILYHSRKKRKDSLERRAELAVLRTYVENQAILEPIFLYRVSKCKQIEQQSSEDCLWTHVFTFLQDYGVKMQNITRSSCAIIGCYLSKKQKLTQYKTQNGEPNYAA